MAAELANVARASLASRSPVRWFSQKPLGRDLHFWLTVTGLDAAPFGRFQHRPATMAVIDDGRYRAALAAGRPDRRPMFTHINGSSVTWTDSAKEDVDAIILATGYAPDLGYLTPRNALDEASRPRHRDGTSLTHPRLAHVGLECQRSLSSASLRGVGRNARRSARRLTLALGRSWH
ncbi:hypothetical protein [Streptomyces agglomeratus]|uniref:hypothetical protein n=1 Tax=Streptomyces agglomeratus TaxID=285458 RepID=UPI000A492379